MAGTPKVVWDTRPLEPKARSLEPGTRHLTLRIHYTEPTWLFKSAASANGSRWARLR